MKAIDQILSLLKLAGPSGLVTLEGVDALRLANSYENMLATLTAVQARGTAKVTMFRHMGRTAHLRQIAEGAAKFEEYVEEEVRRRKAQDENCG